MVQLARRESRRERAGEIRRDTFNDIMVSEREQERAAFNGIVVLKREQKREREQERTGESRL